MAFLAPTIHLNGTSKESLLNQQLAVYRAALELLNALAHATPHDRDYYVQTDPRAGTIARGWHQIKVEHVRDIATEAEALAQQIQEG